MASSLVRTATFLNWVNVGIARQDGTGSPLQIVAVTGVAVVRKNKIIKFYGDAGAYARVLAAVEQERGLTIVTGDIATLFKVPMGVALTVTATLLDPRNGAAAGGGAITITLNNALVVNGGGDGKNNQFASGTIAFDAYAGIDQSGSEVDPLVVTEL